MRPPRLVAISNEALAKGILRKPAISAIASRVAWSASNSRCSPLSGICATGTGTRQGSRGFVFVIASASLIAMFAPLRRQREPPCQSQYRWLIPLGEIRNSLFDISGQSPRIFHTFAVEDVSAQGLRERFLPCREGLIVGRGAAVEGFSESSHPFGHSEIANSHFPQIRIHIIAETIKECLRGTVRRGARDAQAPQDHPQMQHQKIKTPIYRIRNAQIAVERRLSRLRHDHAID